jgi:hypothetical protein
MKDVSRPSEGGLDRVPAVVKADEAKKNGWVVINLPAS